MRARRRSIIGTRGSVHAVPRLLRHRRFRMSAKTPEQRIADLGLSLPAAAAAVANYAPWVITGNLVMTSGNLPWRDGKLAYVGKIGRELSGEDGYKSCQLSCLN